MKKLIITAIMIGFGAGLAVERIVGEGEIEAIKAEIDETLEQVVTEQRELPTKEYSGTVQEILTARIDDVNNVKVKIEHAKAKTEEVFEKSGHRVELKDRVVQIIHEKTQEELIEKKKNNNQIIKWVDELVNDPNTYEDPNDPNEVATLMEFQTIIYDSLLEDGGY
jgi:flagellar basal body-associated protein FliL